MAVQKALDVAEPPHETDGDANLREVYEGAEFYDDVTGVLLDRERVLKTSSRPLLRWRASRLSSACAPVTRATKTRGG